MDKKSFLGFALIIIIISGWMYYNAATRSEIKPTKPATTKVEKKESLTEHRRKEAESKLIAQDSAAIAIGISRDSLLKIQKYGPVFARFTGTAEKFFTVETDLYKAVISSRGMTIRKFFNTLPKSRYLMPFS